MQNPSRWLQSIQYFRAFAIIQVIAYHASMFIWRTDLTALTPQKAIITALCAFTSFAVPHFLFISGVVLYNKYDGGFSLSTFYKKRLSAVMPPYLIWSTFYFFYPYVAAILLFSVFHFQTATYSSISNISQYPFSSVVPLLAEYVKGLVVGISQMWFIVLLIQLYLLYPLLVKFYNLFTRQRNPVYVLSLLFLIQTAWTSLFLKIGVIPFRSLFLTGIFYFVFGFFISEHYEAVKQKIAMTSVRNISLAVLLTTLYYTIVFYNAVFLPTRASYFLWLYEITGPFYCLLLISFYLRISIRWGDSRGSITRYIEKIGEYSFGIYLANLFFIYVFALALTRAGLTIYSLLFYPILFFLSLISSYLTVQAIYRLPLSDVIIGKRRKKHANVNPPP